MLKRFLLFAGKNYYPSGGWRDFIDSFDTKEDAEGFYLNDGPVGTPAHPYNFDWYQIIDIYKIQ